MAFLNHHPPLALLGQSRTRPIKHILTTPTMTLVLAISSLLWPHHRLPTHSHLLQLHGAIDQMPILPVNTKLSTHLTLPHPLLMITSRHLITLEPTAISLCPLHQPCLSSPVPLMLRLQARMSFCHLQGQVDVLLASQKNLWSSIVGPRCLC